MPIQPEKRREVLGSGESPRCSRLITSPPVPMAERTLRLFRRRQYSQSDKLRRVRANLALVTSK